ncbi:MAG TPA: MarR family winged helix-turn-helix transcriptional regulator [Hyphomicrobiaceae bacterium]|jgi:DNA-binding MarR family transcriptional regulator|nr:MarR family winged helix-turn-helix transcriptional regulator [Hyphomicrobiaceae bacterium]
MAPAHAKVHRRPAAKPRPAAGSYVLEQQVGFLLRCAHQRASETFNAVMGRFGVTPRQFAALAKLDDLGSVSQNQLGRLTAMDPATISGVIARLAARGYVAQAADPRDGRLLALALTAAGAAAVGAMKAVAAEVSQLTLAALSEQEAAAFLEALCKIGQMPCLPRPTSRP